MAGIRSLLALLFITATFASPHPAIFARQIVSTCAPTCAATGRAEIQEGAACLCSAGRNFRSSVCNGHPALATSFTTVPRTRTSTTVIFTTRPASTEYTTPPLTRTVRRTTSADITSTVTNNITSVSGTITTTVAFRTVTDYTTVTLSTCKNSPGSSSSSSSTTSLPGVTPAPVMLRRQDTSTSYTCSPSSSWYSSYSAEYGAAAVRSACNCLEGANESTRTTIVTRYSTIIASTATRRSTVRSGTLTTRRTVTSTTTTTLGSTIISTDTSITTVPVTIPVTGTTTITSTTTTYVPVTAPTSFKMYYESNGGRQYAAAAQKSDSNNQNDRFLASNSSDGDTFTLDSSGRVIDTQGTNAIVVATEEAPYDYLKLDNNINADGDNVPKCTWCNGPLNCDYGAGSGNSTGNGTTNFYVCGGFLVLSGQNNFIESQGQCSRVTIRLETVRGVDALNPAATATTDASSSESTSTTSTSSSETGAATGLRKRYEGIGM